MKGQCPAVPEAPLWRHILSFFFPNLKQLTITLPSLKHSSLILILSIIILAALREIRFEFHLALMRSYHIIARPNYAAGVEVKLEARRATYRQQRLESRVCEAVEAMQQYKEDGTPRSAEQRTGEGMERGTRCGRECEKGWHPHPRRKRFRWAAEVDIIED